jgi:hypothetical protein
MSIREALARMGTDRFARRLKALGGARALGGAEAVPVAAEELLRTIDPERLGGPEDDPDLPHVTED